MIESSISNPNRIRKYNKCQLLKKFSLMLNPR